ncbi:MULTISPECIES: DUF2312 domain-containing protein [Methylosinus]|uniref:DUF2312 domain-containing protein n=1 Tax=Methylosinus trichosporium (strain ATCC 35070 / NCIMB 11131 / UNIQEM 75 / OB3b) TaxID=595536 RepID=A0A2D2CYH9_METT3|nr:MULTISPECIES: DUF2312 domain-containing protein [Methylosinus]ATQ67754.1 DUF2312 domain-containing protein [Methylosinus trichosporium OB3b]OBS51139.1 hypothetical protein A8B73_17605 [Methylosinus sp. 3S-1]
MAALLTVDGAALRGFVERIERLAEEKGAIGDDIKDVFGEAKAHGFDPKIIRKIIALRRKDKTEREREDALLALYVEAIGDFFDTPLGGAAERGDE